jgi:hypothetical protein
MVIIRVQENERTKDIIIEQRFHRTIIGQKGAKIREIRDKFNQVQISFPEAGRKSDVVTLRGPAMTLTSASNTCSSFTRSLYVPI